MKKKSICYLLLCILFGVACKRHSDPVTQDKSFFLVDYRNLQDGPDGIAIIDLDPESPDFGKVVSNLELGKGVLPHHIYFDRNDRKIYNIALGPPYLYQLELGYDKKYPYFRSAHAINTGGNMVGEDIYFTRDGRYIVTFMGGRGGHHGGTVGVFDLNSNRLLKTIEVPWHEGVTTFIRHPHGISANEDKQLLMVTSTIHPGLTSGFGNTCTLIDLNNYQVRSTYLVADSINDLTSPVEILLLRDEFPPYALINTMLGGDIWIADYDSASNGFKRFRKFYDGTAAGLGWALEFYIGPDKLLYVSFAKPGKVLVFDLADLPRARLVRTLNAAPGSHHMAFFKSRSGRKLVAVQNNMLNLPGMDSGTIQIFDITTGELCGTVDMKTKYGWMPESIEYAFGKGHYMHH